jgi:hypothetical protein
MMQRPLFHGDSPVSMRQPKTDRLILARYLDDASKDQRLDTDAIDAAHQIVTRWANLERSGRLAQLNETQLRGDFLAQVLGQALGYTGVAGEEPVWHLDQHFPIAGEFPDAVLGTFRQDEPREPAAVIELKGPAVHLDRDRSDGRTAVDQCWDYLVNLPRTCRWGIVSNIVSFRLYERDSTKRSYEHFSLQSLLDIKVFREFYVLFHRKGLIDRTAVQRADLLLDRSRNRQREVSDELYNAYSEHRTQLISHLHLEQGLPVDKAIEYCQRLLDRIIFIAFCEDRELLPTGTIASAYEKLPPEFSPVTNPRWQNFKNLFRFVDKGKPERRFTGYNGGLFAVSPADDLELDDQWTHFFHFVGGFDFADEVNLDVLGHLFERSITELEKLKTTGILGDAEKAEQFARMPQSAKRKQLGIYYTPPELTSRIVQYTVDELIAERFEYLAVESGVSRQDAARGVVPDDLDYWRRCLGILQSLKIVDPACGSGAFLFQAYNGLEHRYLEVIGHLDKLGADDAAELEAEVPHFILQQNLYGVDLSPEAVEITQLALWIRSATEGQTLATLSQNILHGNSLVHDAAIHPAGFDWREKFPEVFARAGASPPPAHRNGAEDGPARATFKPTFREPGFDCVIGNPPWERIKLQEREFFSLPAPEIATATNAAKRRQLVAKLESLDPALFERYQEALASAESLLTYCRKSDQYTLTGRGDVNLYAVFAELASQLVAPHGRVGLLTPSGIASDKTTKDFFAAIAETNRLIRLYDFENKKVFFPDVHASFKFCILNFGGESVKHDAADFVFFTHHVEELEERDRHIEISGADIKLLNPNTRTCPIFRTLRDAEITKAIYRRVPILVDHNREGTTGNPWGISFKRIFDQTNDAELFREAETLKKDGFKLKGNHWTKRAGASSPPRVMLPLYEAKMLQAYDHRAADIVTDTTNWVRQGQTETTSLVNHQNPEHFAMPRFWIKDTAVEAKLEARPSAFLCFKDVTSPTNQRTMIAAMTPLAGIVNSAPIAVTAQNCARTCCLLANLNSFACDFVIRQKISNVHLNFFIVEQLPMLPPDAYAKPCPWSRRKMTLEKWISERVLKLTCTAEDMLPLAEACDFTSGSFQKEYAGRLHKWDEADRAQLMAELDAAYFHLYGISRDDAAYILSTFKGIHGPTTLFPGPATTADYILQLYDELASRT